MKNAWKNDSKMVSLTIKLNEIRVNTRNTRVSETRNCKKRNAFHNFSIIQNVWRKKALGRKFRNYRTRHAVR